MRLITMSTQELKRVEIIQKLIERRINQESVAKILSISVRQVQRLVRSYKKYGANGLISKKRGKPSNHYIPGSTKKEVIDIISMHYRDFGPTLALEKLAAHHGYSISVETLRKWMVEAGIWVTRKQRLKRAYQPRYRRSCYGELVQIDGSYHAWFEGRSSKCCLLVYIDDATSKIMRLLFTTAESMQTYFIATKGYINKHGRPLAFYSDKFGVFRIANKKAASRGEITQFGRALQELDIQLICANTCEAKGRVERANKTLQDRLVKELRLRNISTIEEANAYAEEFIKEYNNKFGKEPVSNHDMHRPLAPYHHLADILCYKTTRTISNSLTFQYNRQMFLLEDNESTRILRRKTVTLHEYPDGSIKIFYKQQELKYQMIYDRADPTAMQKPTQGSICEDNKYLEEMLGATLEYARQRSSQLPPKTRSRSCPARRHIQHIA